MRPGAAATTVRAPLCYRATHPPSTARTCPWTYAAASEARNTTTSPMSSGVPQRPAGIRTRELLEPHRVGQERAVHVGGMYPGATALTLTPGPLVAQRLGELGDRAPARGVRGHGGAALEGQQRREVHHLALAALGHRPAEELAELERRAQVDVKHPRVERGSTAGCRSCVPALLTRMSTRSSVSTAWAARATASPSARPMPWLAPVTTAVCPSRLRRSSAKAAGVVACAMSVFSRRGGWCGAAVRAVSVGDGWGGAGLGRVPQGAGDLVGGAQRRLGHRLDLLERVLDRDRGDADAVLDGSGWSLMGAATHATPGTFSSRSMA